ncbi:MAG: hypothetical protein K8963_09265 [Proteobacteria bacterium]|nr:hypothetical protein [Pseudomonadota bacterium]
MSEKQEHDWRATQASDYKGDPYAMVMDFGTEPAPTLICKCEGPNASRLAAVIARIPAMCGLVANADGTPIMLEEIGHARRILEDIHNGS